MTAASTRPGFATSALRVTPPPIERPSIAIRSGSTYGSRRRARDGVDRVLGVAEPGLAVEVGGWVGAGVAAVVGVQHREPGPGQPVLLAGQPLAGDVDRRLDVAVVEDDARERALAGRHEQHAGDGEVAAAVGDASGGCRRRPCRAVPAGRSGWARASCASGPAARPGGGRPAARPRSVSGASVGLGVLAGARRASWRSARADRCRRRARRRCRRRAARARRPARTARIPVPSSWVSRSRTVRGGSGLRCRPAARRNRPSGRR